MGRNGGELMNFTEVNYGMTDSYMGTAITKECDGNATQYVAIVAA